MKFRIARDITKREYFEFEAESEEAAEERVAALNIKIENGEDYDIEDMDFVDEKDVESENEYFELTGWRE